MRQVFSAPQTDYFANGVVRYATHTTPLPWYPIVLCAAKYTVSLRRGRVGARLALSARGPRKGPGAHQGGDSAVPSEYPAQRVPGLLWACLVPAVAACSQP